RRGLSGDSEPGGSPFHGAEGRIYAGHCGRTGEGKPELTEEVERQLQERRQSGAAAKEAVTQIAKATGLSKKELYRAWIKGN
ncbi:MAG: hypothetical protein KKF26_06945, partial [Chloroflexi bacterium]|nr:hypothetical protein [Chloroflexota bacterium]